MFIDVKDNPYPLDKEKAMSRMLEPAVSPIDAAIERIMKIHNQLSRKLITENDADEQYLRILVTFKMEVIKDTFGDLQDRLSDIEQLFNEVRDSVEEADFLSVFQPE
jgi:archaellum component FlaC